MSEHTEATTPQASTQAMIVTDTSAEMGFTEADPLGPQTDSPEGDGELLAGKYKTTEELVNAYKELESKLGQKPDETEAAEVPDAEKVAAVETTDEAAALLSEKGLDIRRFTTEFERTGQLSEDSYATLEAKGITRDMVNAYIDGNRALVHSQVQDIKNSVGGEAAFQSMMAWAQANLTPQQKAAYEATLATGNVEAIRLAALGLKARHEAATGKEPSVVVGGKAPGMSDAPAGFESRAQMVEAIRDPRYERDPAYRAKVERRVLHSNF